MSKRSVSPLVAFLVAAGATALALSACGGGEAKPKPKPKEEAPPGFPEGYTTWKKINAETILREDEGVAREIYADAKPELGKDTVLVKEQYGLVDGAKAELVHVAVMRRTGADTHNGWTFMVFDPATKKELEGGDTAGCVGCHTLVAEQDLVFTPIDALVAPAEETPEGEGAEGAAAEGEGGEAAEGEGGEAEGGDGEGEAEGGEGEGE